MWFSTNMNTYLCFYFQRNNEQVLALLNKIKKGIIYSLVIVKPGWAWPLLLLLLRHEMVLYGTATANGTNMNLELQWNDTHGRKTKELG